MKRKEVFKALKLTRYDAPDVVKVKIQRYTENIIVEIDVSVYMAECLRKANSEGREEEKRGRQRNVVNRRSLINTREWVGVWNLWKH